jgi:hypothetical protein
MKDRRKGETIARATVIATSTTLALIAMRRRITIRGSATEISIVGISRQRLNTGTMPRIQTHTTIATTVVEIVTMIEIEIEIAIATAIGIGIESRGRNWDRYGRYGGSSELRQTALNAGYNAGIKDGRDDRRRNRHRSYSDFSEYRNATTDYSSKLGDRELYRRYYREGFENGYDDGWNGY